MPNFYPEAAKVLPALSRLLAQTRSAGRFIVHAVERHRPGFDDYGWRKLPRHHLADDPDAAFVEGSALRAPPWFGEVGLEGIAKDQVAIRRLTTSASNSTSMNASPFLSIAVHPETDASSQSF
jgi:hypothetical protein